MRPYRRWVREPVGPHLLLQLHERRYAFALEGTRLEVHSREYSDATCYYVDAEDIDVGLRE